MGDRGFRSVVQQRLRLAGKPGLQQAGPAHLQTCTAAKPECPRSSVRDSQKKAKQHSWTFADVHCDWTGAKGCKCDRYRQELSNEYLVAKIGVHTAEDDPLKVRSLFQLIVLQCFT